MQKRPGLSSIARSIVLDRHVTLPSFFSQINDVPVTHISDIEPLVYESVATIKFLVARPAQEVGLEENAFYSRNGNMHDRGVVELFATISFVCTSRVSRTSGVGNLHDLVLSHNSRKSGVLLDDKYVNNVKQNVVVSKALKISQIAQIC